MKKGLLRTLSAVVAISMLFCMSVVAFADVTTSTSVTSYDVAAGKVTVTTEVTGAQPGEQVAFLVEKGANILWIDQRPATGGAASSSFTASVADAVGAVAKVGTTNTAATAITQAGAIALPNYTVTWNSNSTKSKVVAVIANEEVNSGATTTDYVTFYVAAAAGEELVSVAYGDTTDTEFVGASKTYAVTANTAFTFTFAEKTFAEGAAAPTIPSKEVVPATEASKVASVTATATDAKEFGILVAKKGYDFTQITSLDGLGYDSAPVRKYDALGANAAGQFVIQLQDTDSVFFVDDVKYDACVYALGSSLEKGDVFALN